MNYKNSLLIVDRDKNKNLLKFKKSNALVFTLMWAPALVLHSIYQVSFLSIIKDKTLEPFASYSILSCASLLLAVAALMTSSTFIGNALKYKEIAQDKVLLAAIQAIKKGVIGLNDGVLFVEYKSMRLTYKKVLDYSAISLEVEGQDINKQLNICQKVNLASILYEEYKLMGLKNREILREMKSIAK